MTGKIYKWDKKVPKFLRPIIDRIFEILTEIQPVDGLGATVDEGMCGRNISTNPGGKSGKSGSAEYFNFQLFDASEPGNAAVLILDGVVYGPNNDAGVDPDGMPSDDTYELGGLNDGDEIWMEIDWSADDPPIIESASLAAGAGTPDDTEETTYITIGHVEVIPSDTPGGTPKAICRNELCGDAVIEIPPYPQTDNFVLTVQDGNLIWAEVCDAEC